MVFHLGFSRVSVVEPWVTPHLAIEARFQHETDWEIFNDYSIITMIKAHPEAKQAQDILKRIETRDLYKMKVVRGSSSLSETSETLVGYHNHNSNPWFYEANAKVRIDLEKPTNFLSTRSLQFT